MRLKSICKSFGDIEVLKDFNLNIAEGEHIAIMGKSGKGKTTVLNIIMGFEVPDSGFVEVTKDISTVFQENRLCEDFFAISNVCLLKKNKSIAKKILDRLGIDSTQKVKTMSGGQKRRVALARCLARNAGLYIFDEALKGLDDKTKAVAMDVIKEYTKGRSAIFITHDINEAKEFADRIVEI
ncbi:ATP-binding cassette domain-containing protein [Lachnoanaerobaculum saburreum]|nr:ATP-binding cassette domain-containing protein [Lachnoanaerobaculum saburreum]